MLRPICAPSMVQAVPAPRPGDRYSCLLFQGMRLLAQDALPAAWRYTASMT